MATIQVDLPERVQAFVESQASADGFPNASEYVQALIQNAWEVKQRAEMDAKIQEGIDAFEQGDNGEMTSADWDRLRAELVQRHQQRNGHEAENSPAAPR